ncbi:MAG: AAA family ATPase, partial [Treponemataceae bacterium]
VDRISQSSTNRNSFSAWGKVSVKQKKFIDAILNFQGHVIATMRSKTEWVVSDSGNGKFRPEKLGLAPEQGKGIEYEFDMLLEMNQNHQGLITKDRTGKFQDHVIDKPSEEFGEKLYQWLTGDEPISKLQSKKESIPFSSSVPIKENQKTTVFAREKANALINQIGDVMTRIENGKALFTEEEKDQIRSLVAGVNLSKDGLKELEELEKVVKGELESRIPKTA